MDYITLGLSKFRLIGANGTRCYHTIKTKVPGGANIYSRKSMVAFSPPIPSRRNYDTHFGATRFTIRRRWTYFALEGRNHIRRRLNDQSIINWLKCASRAKVGQISMRTRIKANRQPLMSRTKPDKAGGKGKNTDHAMQLVLWQSISSEN